MTRHPSHTETLIKRLKDPARARQYLRVALEEYDHDGDLAGFLLALRRAVEAQGGMSKVARKAGLNRANLYAALSADGNPQLKTIQTILHALGMRLSVAVRDEEKKPADEIA